uniref:Uncharacterized protein n=1 Tax=Ascaris lumbricoides TaxID=6252 RepID=A0A0M3HTJ6_ASCLU
MSYQSNPRSGVVKESRWHENAISTCTRDCSGVGADANVQRKELVATVSERDRRRWYVACTRSLTPPPEPLNRLLSKPTISNSSCLEWAHDESVIWRIERF